jgi:hypothetical protein
MSIEMDNPQTLQEKIDAASNLVAQIGLALNIGDVSHAKNAQKKALDLLMSVLMSGELDTE